MIVAIVAVVGVLAICLTSLLGRSPLKISKDYFFVFWLFQGMVYILFSPVISVQGESGNLQGDYALLIAASVSLFFVPAVVIYRMLRNSRNEEQAGCWSYSITLKQAWFASA